MSRFGDHYRFRSELVDLLTADFLGPVGGEDEIITDGPVTSYATGVLYPRRSDEEQLQERRAEVEKDVGEADAGADEAVPDTGVSAADLQAPSSMGITFAVAPKRGNTVEVSFRAAVYDPIDASGRPVEAKRSASRGTEEIDLRWRRRALEIAPITVDVTEPARTRPELVTGLVADVNVRRPDSKTGEVAVTIALMNVKEIGRHDIQDAHCFFQPGIEVTARGAGETNLVERRGSSAVGVDEEEVRVNRLLYRHAPTFAVGHGCAAVWDWEAPPVRDAALVKGEPAAVSAVRTSFVPTREVLLTDSNREIDATDLSMMHLASADEEDVLAALDRLVDGYRAWIAERAEEAGLLQTSDFGAVADGQIEQCAVACDRMESGIELLRADPKAMRAFRLANEAMAVQRARAQWIRGGRTGEIKPDGEWRPFQIAFVLLCLDGIVDPDHSDRGLADLLWFPTGGGKTEAYLGIIAFTVFLRRLREKDGGGVTAIMRYTLRLLTLQQFERAAALICAMEAMRQDADDLGGDEIPISLGMWVGKAATPNTLKDAKKSLEKLRAGQVLQEMNPVQLRGCPWCGTAMNEENYEVLLESVELRIFCSNGDCRFHRRLPVHVVDQTIYRARPTLIIATVDKFAQIAWRAEAADLFNRIDDGTRTPAPELIVQDELHLISGPLGSLAGLYETAIDIAADKPKVIASTATIRRASDQVRRLFDREVRQFPPAGLDARDSWFAVETAADAKASRRYVGLLTPNTSQATLLVRTYAALLHHALQIEGEDGVRDAYWTLVGYFSSLRLLAAAELQFYDDVQDRLHLLAEHDGTDRRAAGLLAELTSRVQSSDIPQRLKDLEIRLPSDDALDAVLATNMISVGVDVDRLGLMALMGQPQTTAEYIQSSSRVGRQHPGLAIMMFNAARSRDRSHYESFTSYHSALYRQVESSSVTPFSSRARDRALHAVLVAILRLCHPEARLNGAAGEVLRFEHRIEEVTDLILGRVRTVAENEVAGTERDLREIVERWRMLAAENPKLVYAAPASFKRSEPRPANAALLRYHSDEDLEEAFPTLTSLRDVDAESHLYKEV